MSATPRRLLCFSLALIFAFSGPVHAQEEDPAQLWADFNHYVLVARPQLAADAGRALLERTEGQSDQLLEIVEDSDYADRYDDILVRAQRNETTREVAGQLEEAIQQARIDNSRDPERIARNIELLDEGSRAYRNAVERLRAAGQHAAPQMLATLQNPDKEDLHPFVVNALVQLGRPVVDPLSQAMPHLDAVRQGQVAQVLSRIGYPKPVAILKDLIESDETDPTAKERIRRAYNQLRQQAELPSGIAAAQLYLMEGQQYYSKATENPRQIQGFDSAREQGVLWTYNRDAGLVKINVPPEIYGDVLAMRSARRALDLNAELDAALSLHLTANLRRENRLPAGTSDPTYPESRQSASFYAMVAGPTRLHDVLSQALDDADSTLALDAIEALSRTAGTDALVQRNAARQPLLRALTFPDRRVRFRAAEALAQARPKEAFEGSDRVVPVLAGAVRVDQARHALVLTDDQEKTNRILGVLEELGYEAFGGQSLSDVQGQLDNRSGVELVVVDQPIDRVGQLVEQTRGNFLLAGAPLLALADSGDQIRLNERFEDNPRLHSAVAGEPEEIRSAINAVAAEYTGPGLSEDQNLEFALTALRLLREMAVSSPVYAVENAEPALTRALEDDRLDVVTGAGRVLAAVETDSAQQALADKALEAQGQVQVALLQNLAESANQFGNRLNQRQTAGMTELVEQSSGETAGAAAEAHGALTLPTSNAVGLITGNSGQ